MAARKKKDTILPLKRFGMFSLEELLFKVCLCFCLVNNADVLADQASRGSTVLETERVVDPKPDLENSLIFTPVRWDHNFALTLGLSRGSWDIQKFGPLEGGTYESRAVYAKFHYSFHLPLVGDFGYVLGSSFGFYIESEGSNNDRFRRASSLHFPGIHLGLVYNISPIFRAGVGVETYLERLDGLSVISEETEYRLSVTMKPDYDFLLYTDIFHSDNWGIRLEAHKRLVVFRPPRNSDDQVIGARFSKRDFWIGLGIVRHQFVR